MTYWATKFFFEKFVKPSGLPSYRLNVRSLMIDIEIHVFSMSKTFVSNAGLKLAKTQSNIKQHPETKLWIFESYSHSSSTLSSKNNRTYSKKEAK